MSAQNGFTKLNGIEGRPNGLTMKCHEIERQNSSAVNL